MSEAGQCSWSKKFLPGPIRMKLSLLCCSEAGVAGCCDEWGQLCHLQQLIEGFGTVPAGREDEIFKESKVIKVTQNTLFPVLLMHWFLENGVAHCNGLTRGKGGSKKIPSHLFELGIWFRLLMMGWNRTPTFSEYQLGYFGGVTFRLLPQFPYDKITITLPVFTVLCLLFP